MRSCKKISICFTAFFALLIACNDRQDKIGWEPEVAVPLAQLTVDFNKKVNMADYARNFFKLVGQAEQNKILYTAITQGLDDSVKRRLPRYLQNDVDVFVSQYHSLSVPEYRATALLLDLFDSFEQNGSITAINNFTYYVLKNLPNELQARAVDSLCNIAIEMRESLGLDMSTLTDKSDELQRLKFQLAVSTRLKVNAQVQLYLRDLSGYIYDSLFSVQDGRHEGQMPFKNVVGDEYKQRIICNYPTPDSARKALQVQTISLIVTSDALGLDTSLLWLKDLHNRKIHASVGIMFKANLDDMIEQ